MATTAAMVLNAPKGKVSFRNLIVNVQNNTFSIEYAILEGRKRKFIYEKVNGVITQNFRDWLTKGFFVKDESGSTTANRTSKFKLHLDRKGIEWKEGILPTLEWTCDNHSPDSDECPFKLTLSERYQPVLDVVYTNSKHIGSVEIDPNTGREKINWTKPMYQNLKREMFVRLRKFQFKQQMAEA